jgi:hypothetical protein
MKRTVGILAAFLCAALVFGQQPSLVLTTAPAPTPVPTPGPLQFQEVVPVEDATRDQLYDAALVWFPSAFKSGKDVLQVQNKEAGMLVGTGVERYEPAIFISSSCTRGELRYRITVEVKEGRYRYTIDGFTHEGGTPACRGNGISWGLLTTNPISPSIKGFSSGMEQEMWADMKKKATITALKQDLTTEPLTTIRITMSDWDY